MLLISCRYPGVTISMVPVTTRRIRLFKLRDHVISLFYGGSKGPYIPLPHMTPHVMDRAP
eukprot:877622-Rhodomonas_salina.1